MTPKRSLENQQGYEAGVEQGERNIIQKILPPIQGSEWNSGFDEGAAHRRELEMDEKIRSNIRTNR